MKQKIKVIKKVIKKGIYILMSKKNKPLDIISKDIKNEKKSRKQILDDIDDIDYIGSNYFLPSFYLKE